MGQLGRLAAPTLGASIYAVLSATKGLGWALNGYMLTFTALLVTAHVIAWPQFIHIYDTSANLTPRYMKRAGSFSARDSQA